MTMDEGSASPPEGERGRSVETRLRAKNIASRLFEEDTTVKVGRFVVLGRLGMGAMGAVYRAHDPTLNRKVALKVLHPDRRRLGTSEASTLRREARALAQLSHPNVVAVHEVGGHDDEVWIAMEWVDGVDLATRLDALAKDGKAELDIVVSLLLQAGEGLAAAHRAGLVHRDFKPANVLVGEDGRVRVADFGLASLDQPETVDEHEPSQSSDYVGAGTPAYMAPEQRHGEVDARADQFAFCVVLWEALFGERPDPDPPLPGHVEPRRRAVGQVLRKGLALEPHRRHSEMQALLDAIRAVVFEAPRRWRQRAYAAAAGLVGLTAGLGWVLTRDSDDPCSGAAERLARHWSPEERTTALARLSSLDTPYGTEAVPLLGEKLDVFSARWVDTHAQTCRAHARRELSERVFEYRMSCLDAAAAGLGALAQVAGEDAELADLVAGAAALPSPLTCETLQLPEGTLLPPVEIRKDVGDVDTELARARAHLAAGDSARALEVADAALHDARRLEFGPAIARAQHERGRVSTTAGPLPELSLETASAALDEASQLALKAGDHRLAIEAWSRAAWLRGMSGEDPSALLEQSSVLVAMAQGPTSPSVAEALLYNNLGGLHLARSDTDAARGWFRRSQDVADRLSDPPAELQSAALNLALTTSENARRDRLFDRVIEERRASLGKTHPQVLEVELVLAATTASEQRAGEVLETLGEAYRRYHPKLAKQRAEIHEEAAWSCLARGQLEKAREHLGALAELEPLDPLVKDVALGYLSLVDGELEDAEKAFLRVSSHTTDSPWQQGSVAHAHLGLAIARNELAQLRVAAARLAELPYLPTAALVRRVTYARERFSGSLADAALAADRWRNGTGDRAALNRALQDFAQE